MDQVLQSINRGRQPYRLRSRCPTQPGFVLENSSASTTEQRRVSECLDTGMHGPRIGITTNLQQRIIFKTSIDSLHYQGCMHFGRQDAGGPSLHSCDHCRAASGGRYSAIAYSGSRRAASPMTGYALYIRQYSQTASGRPSAHSHLSSETNCCCRQLRPLALQTGY